MKPVAVAEIDHAELTLRLMEIGLGVVRPAGKPTRELLNEAISAAADDPVKSKILDDFQRMAATSIKFVAEQINAAKAIN